MPRARLEVSLRECSLHLDGPLSLRQRVQSAQFTERSERSVRAVFCNMLPPCPAGLPPVRWSWPAPSSIGFLILIWPKIDPSFR